MLKGASEASGKVYNRTFKVTSLNHTSCTNSWVIQSGQVDFHKLSFHIKCNSWFQLHLWKRLKKKSETSFFTAGTTMETIPKHTYQLLLQFHLSFIPLLSSTFSTLQPPCQQLRSLPTMPLPALFFVPHSLPGHRSDCCPRHISPSFYTPELHEETHTLQHWSFPKLASGSDYSSETRKPP